MIDLSCNHFELLGLPQRYRIDAAVLDRAYRELQSKVHPDRFAGGTDAEQRAALQSSARVNEAYGALKDPVLRAQYLLGLHGIDAVGETDTRLPMEFLERQLERREEAEAALEAGDARGLAAQLAAVRADALEIETALAVRLDTEKGFAEARTPVRELTFLHKLAGDLDAMLARLDG